MVRVRGSVSGPFSYPASQSGGSQNVTLHYDDQVPVDVNIHVDTDSFDASVGNCNQNVNILTGAVVATQTAQVASIKKNAKKIASTIIEGFFKTIRYEISQKMTELSQKVEALIVHLKELATATLGKKKEMEADYNRITERYTKIFNDLNTELSNRIFELDKPVFLFTKETNIQSARTTSSDLVNTVAVFGRESGDLQAKVSASLTKKRALDTLEKAKAFLWQQKMLDYTLIKCVSKIGGAGKYYSPVSFIETNLDSQRINKEMHTPSYLSTLNDTKTNELLEAFADASGKWNNMPGDQKDAIVMYFNAELSKHYPQNDTHSQRVKKTIMNLVNNSSIKVNRTTIS